MVDYFPDCTTLLSGLLIKGNNSRNDEREHVNKKYKRDDVIQHHKTKQT